MLNLGRRLAIACDWLLTRVLRRLLVMLRGQLLLHLLRVPLRWEELILRPL